MLRGGREGCVVSRGLQGHHASGIAVEVRVEWIRLGKYPRNWTRVIERVFRSKSHVGIPSIIRAAVGCSGFINVEKDHQSGYIIQDLGPKCREGFVGYSEGGRKKLVARDFMRLVMWVELLR